MNAEKKLGLAFVGILGVAFCGVLTMRLLEANKAEQIDINVGGPSAAAPQFDPAKNDASKPATPAAPTPPEAPRFANNTSSGAANTAGGRPSSYLPPLPKTPTPPAGDSRYATGAAAPFGAMPSSNPTASTATPTAATQGNPYASTASRYGSPAAAASTAGQAQTPAAPAGMTASPPYGTMASAPAGNSATGSRYGTPSSPTAPPSFSAATPTAAATLTPAAATSGSPYGTPTTASPSMVASSTPSGAASGLNPSPAASSVGSDNPLRGSSPSGGVASGFGSSSEPSTAGRYSTPNIPTSPSGNNYATSPAGSPPSTPTMAANGGGYGTPSPSAPSAPFAGAPTLATASSSTSSTASPGMPTNSLREPRAFDASAVPSQPLVASNPTAPRAPAAAPYGNTLRATADVASPVGASSGMTGERTIAPAAATVPFVAPAPPAAPAVKNTPYVVQSDDNLWNISKKVYGDGSYYRALFAYNSDRYPHAEDVRVGSVLDVPPADFLKQRYPELVSGAVGGDGRPTDVALAGGRQAAAATSYTVREGDTLFDIARRQLGKASRWNEIYELNRASLGENLENLRPGMQLQLPQ